VPNCRGFQDGHVPLYKIGSWGGGPVPTAQHQRLAARAVERCFASRSSGASSPEEPDRTGERESEDRQALTPGACYAKGAQEDAGSSENTSLSREYVGKDLHILNAPRAVFVGEIAREEPIHPREDLELRQFHCRVVARKVTVPPPHQYHLVWRGQIRDSHVGHRSAQAPFVVLGRSKALVVESNLFEYSTVYEARLHREPVTLEQSW
jgi:hypothetical protein